MDVVPEMKEILGENIEIIEGGALDGLTYEEIAALAPGPEDYVLVTRLRDGSSVKIAERYIIPRMQTQIERLVAEGAQMIALLCTGEFPDFSCPRLILRPQVILYHFTSGVATGRRLGVIVPDKDQVEQTKVRWAGVGEKLKVQAASPYGPREEIWRAACSLREWGAEVIVLDCIGFNVQMKREVHQHAGAPVILPRTVLARTLQELLA